MVNIDISEPYATPQLYRALIKKLDAGDDMELIDDLLLMSRVMDKKLHRFFYKDTEVVTRYFTTRYSGQLFAEAENPWRGLRGEPDLYIDDLASADDLEIIIDTDRDGSYADETALGVGDYQLWPRNASVGPEPKPYTCIHLIGAGNQVYWPPATEVKVTGYWGWPNGTPLAIQHACCHLTALLRLETPRATRTISGVETLLETSREGQDILKTVLAAYGKTTGFGAFGGL